MSILAVLTQPGPVEFVAPALGRASDATMVTDARWLPPADRPVFADRVVGLPADPADFAHAVRVHRPATLVVSTAGKAEEAAAVAAGRDIGARIVQVVDAPYNHLTRVRGSAPPDMRADAIAVIAERDRAALLEGNIPAELVTVVGHPGWERVPSAPAADPRRMVFLSQPILMDGFARYGYSETAAWDLVRAVRRERPDLFDRLYWAPHPREARPAIPDAECDAIADDSARALRDCGTAIGIFSTALTYAFLSGRRVVSVQPGLPGEDFCALSRGGWITRCGTKEEIAAALEADSESTAAMLRSEMVGSADRLVGLLGIADTK